MAVPTRSPLPFVVETGEGLSTATSYVSIEYSDTYMDRILDSYKAVWLAADTFQKEQALVWATQLFDDYVYFPNYDQKYRNIRLSRTQALHFPRAGMSDYDGYVIDQRSVPEFVKRATTQMAFELLKADRVVEPTRGLLAASVGPLSVTFDPNYAHLTRVIPRSVIAIVAPYGGLIRGMPGLKSIPLMRA